MATSHHKFLKILALSSALLLITLAQAAPEISLRDSDVRIDAASSTIDSRNNMMSFNDIVIAQGKIRVSARKAKATNLDFEKATWIFTGNVTINIESGNFQAEEASIDFLKNKIISAKITGEPAKFAQIINKILIDNNKKFVGSAKIISYWVENNSITLTKGAWLSDGKNEIYSEQLSYDLLKQRIESVQNRDGSERVKIIMRPSSKTTLQ